MTDNKSAFDYRPEMKACAEAINLRPPLIIQPEDHWVELNGIRLHYLDWGNSHLPHLLLLHGGSLTAHTWDMAALLLRERYHIVAPDQRGHGDSDATPLQQSKVDNYELMLQDTAALIEYLGYDTISLCGMSMGALNAIRYTAHCPQRLSALAIVDVGPTVMLEGRIEMEQFRNETETMVEFEDFVERAIRFNPQRKPEHLRYSLIHSLKRVEGGWTWKQQQRTSENQVTAEAHWKSEREERARWMRADLGKIKIPTLLIRGEKSKMLSPEGAQDAVALLKDGELAVIKNAGHSVQGDNPAEFSKILDSFLTRQGIRTS